MPPYTANASMYELTVFTCWRGLRELVPVPGATPDRWKSIVPKSFRKASSGSFLSNGIGALSPPSCLSPNVWSRNWPHVQTHCVAPRREKTF